MTALDYKIVIPSRKRTHNMERLQSLLPTACICVDEREEDDYRQYVDNDKLIIHPAFKKESCAAAKNWIIDNVQCEMLITGDDDLIGVQTLVGKQHRITDPDVILDIIENAAQIITDLDVSTFAFSGTGNSTIVKPDMTPAIPFSRCDRVIGVRGPARHRRFRTDLVGRADFDWALRTILEDRVMYVDNRFYFDHGPLFSGRGGNVGIITPQIYYEASLKLKEIWGQHASFKTPSFGGNREADGFRINVKRWNKKAQR